MRSQVVKNSLEAAQVSDKLREQTREELDRERGERIALEGRVGELTAKLESMPDLADLTHMIADHQALDVTHYARLAETQDAMKKDLDQIARFMKRVGDELVKFSVESRKGRG